MRTRPFIGRLVFPSLLAGSLAVLAAACAPERPADPTAATSCAEAPLHYHVAVDRSGTMATHWRTVVNGVAAAIEHVPEGASLHVYTFAGDVLPLGSWAMRTGEVGRIVSEVREAMGTSATGVKTHIHGMADTLAGRIRAEPNARHVVLFVSDDEDDPPAGYDSTDRARARAAWANLDRRIPDSLRVVAVRLGPKSTFLSMVPRADQTPVSELSSMGGMIAQHLENDPFARQRKRERREPMVSAALEPASQDVPYPGGDVRIKIVSQAECGSYRLTDGTSVGPGDTVFAVRRIRSRLGFREALTGSASASVPAAEALPADVVHPLVASYVPATGTSAQDTTYAGGGHVLAPLAGEVVFTPAPLWIRWAAGGIGLLLVLAALLAAVLPLVPPLGGRLRTTPKLDPDEAEVDLAPARAGGEVTVPPPPLAPGIRVRVARASRWGNPWKTVLVFRVVGVGSVGVAKANRDTGEYDVRWLAPAEGMEVHDPAFILWPKAADADRRPDRLPEGRPETYPGYMWRP